MCRDEKNVSRLEVIGGNLEYIHRSIKEAALESGRDPESIRLVAVTKNFPPEDVEAAYNRGQVIFGENKAQELVAKASALRDRINCQWHMIGTLQTNKAKMLVGLASLIHSVDRTRLLNVIQNRAARMDLIQDVLLQVNVSGEETKHGFEPEQLEQVLEARGTFPNIRFLGLMTMAPYYDDPERARPVFSQLRILRDSLVDRYDLTEFVELSMGMTGDYKQAISEGSTIVRIGSAIFGQRIQ